MALADTLAELRAHGARLVYWPAAEACDDAAVRRQGGLLADRKTTFAVDFGTLDFADTTLTGGVETLSATMPVADLESLAVQTGEYSRFAVDPNVPRERFVALYKLWIAKSLRREIGSEVLVVRDGEHIVGMATLGEKNRRGDIDLIAVDRAYRRRGHGEKLVRAAQKWFVGRGYERGQVVTQADNVPACGLYRKCGYTVERVEYFYHFWL